MGWKIKETGLTPLKKRLTTCFTCRYFHVFIEKIDTKDRYKVKYKKAFSLLVWMPLLLLTGCSSNKLKEINPSSYSSASDFANASIKQTSCMGYVDSLYARSGFISTDNHGVQIYSGNHSGTHCSAIDFRNVLESYCQYKGGHYRYNWCEKDNEPVFHIDEFTIQEKSNALSEAQWKSVARTYLGYESVKEIDAKKVQADAHNILVEQQKQSRLRSGVRASLGDFVCREDLLTNQLMYNGPVYYGAYVEAKSNGKLKLRIVWHGRKGIEIINEHKGDLVVWEAPQGWFHCDQEMINSLP